MFEKQEIAISSHGKENVFLIDWLTVVSHVDTVDSLKAKLGLDNFNIPWEDEVKFMNGYPLQTKFHGITISYGADREEYYKDKTKARTDMGICLNLSGQGCRAFEEYGHGVWMKLFDFIFVSSQYNITRLDLAYDDHSGILDIFRIKNDTEDQNYVSKSRWWMNQYGSEGTSVYIGSPQSQIRIRIYDKAAERGFDDGRHWIRVELQLRKDRAYVAAAELMKQQHIGRVAAGILRNYLTYRVPSGDTNKSRWEICYYWQQLLFSMERISLWISPGEPYNFSKTESWLMDSVSPSIYTYYRLHGSLGALLAAFQREQRELPEKYRRVIQEHELQQQKRKEEELNACLEALPGDPEIIQLEMDAIFGTGRCSDPLDQP